MSASELTVEGLLRAHAPHAPESLRERVLALEPKQRGFALPPRRLVLVALPAAVGLAVVAAVIHGIAGSGTTSQPVAREPAVTVPQHEFAPVTHGSGGSATDFAQSQLKVAAPTPTATAGRLQHTDASIRIRVADTDALSAATKRATQIATSLGGYAQSVEYSTPQSGEGVSTIELRVPSQNVKAALSRLAGLGTLVSQELSVNDLEQRLQTQSEQIAQLRRRVAAIRKALLDMSVPDAQRVLLQIRLAESKRALAQRLNARKGTLSAGATARIALVIGTERAVVVPHERSRIDRMLRSAVGFLAIEGIVVLYALIVISPFALVAGLLLYRRRRSIDRLLAT